MSDVKVIQLTEPELRELVSESVKQTLAAFGVDVEKPLEMQRDFQHLRDWREAVSAVKRRGMLAFVTILVTGLLGAVWIGIRFHLHIPG